VFDLIVYTIPAFGTFRPFRVAFHEYQAMWRDVRRARDWHERAGYVFGGPAWKPGRGRRGLAHTEPTPVPGGGAPPPTDGP